MLRWTRGNEKIIFPCNSRCRGKTRKHPQVMNGQPRKRQASSSVLLREVEDAGNGMYDDLKDDKGKEEATGPPSPLLVGPNVIHVVGEGDFTTVCILPLDPPDFAPMDADTVRVFACSALGEGVAASTMTLLSHPDRHPLVGPACLIHGGSTVHLVSTKDRDPAEPTVIFYRDMHLEIPGTQDPKTYACDLLALPLDQHEIKVHKDGRHWLTPTVPQPPPPVYLHPRGNGVGGGLPVFKLPSALPKFPDPARALQPARKLVKRMPPDLADADCAWEDSVKLHDDEEDDEDHDLGSVDLYNPDEWYEDPEREEQEDEPASVAEAPPAQRESDSKVKGSWDATLHMPDGSRVLHPCSPYGTLATDVLRAVCTAKGLPPAYYRILEHGLPMTVDLVHGACSYDVRMALAKELLGPPMKKQ